MGIMEQDGYDKVYCYPHTEVMKNKLGIEDDVDKLESVINGITMGEIAKIEKNGGVQGAYDFEHYLSIHREIFGSIFDWAGEIRTVDISKEDSSMFCHHNFIFGYAKDVFRGLNVDKLKTMTKDEFAMEIATLFGDLNALHPFREGNGRTERVFLRQLARECGYDLDFTKIPREQYITASKESLLCNYTSSFEMFKMVLAKNELVAEKKETTSGKPARYVINKEKQMNLEH